MPISTRWSFLSFAAILSLPSIRAVEADQMIVLKTAPFLHHRRDKAIRVCETIAPWLAGFQSAGNLPKQ
jgi:hypothetical protein